MKITDTPSIDRELAPKPPTILGVQATLSVEWRGVELATEERAARAILDANFEVTRDALHRPFEIEEDDSENGVWLVEIPTWAMVMSRETGSATFETTDSAGFTFRIEIEWP